MLDESTHTADPEFDRGALERRVAELEAHLAEARERARAASAPGGSTRAHANSREQAMLASLLDPLISIDEMGIVQSASDSVERVFGYRPDELAGRNVNVLMPEPHHSAHDGYLEHYRRTGETGIIGRTREFQMVRKDGSEITCALSVSRADPAEGPAVFVGTFRDITALKRATEALSDSERRFHAIFDHVFQFMGLLDAQGRVLEINQTALDSIRARREEIVGRLFWETPWWQHDQDLQAQVRRAVESAARGEFVRFESQHTSSSGNLREVDFSLKPVRDENGNVVLLIPEGRDVSDLKRAQRTETAMLRALATIGESAALLAHEIKNPITAVSVALRAVATELGEDHRAVLEDLVVRMQRIEQMMRRTLSFAKPIDLHEKKCDAALLFDAVESQLAATLQESGAKVVRRVAPDGVRFRGDPVLLGEVLLNLVTNSIEAGAKHVEFVAGRPAGGGILLSVEDDGPGVPESLREALFKPFVTTKRKGNGLGLSICRKIAEAHGGTLDLDRARKVGTCFAMRLPAERMIP